MHIQIQPRQKLIITRNLFLIFTPEQMFEISEQYMRRDPSSLLAQLCESNPPLVEDAEGGFYFDRDWWLFRYIVVFLRDGTLPEDRALLAQLYREAGFWHLNELQKAIEEDKLHLRAAPTPSKDSNGIENKDISAWWRKVPAWHKEDVEAATEEKSKSDWWTGTSYNGRSYMPMSKDPTKVVTNMGSKDVLSVPDTTWYAYSEPQQGGGGGGFGSSFR